ncbi:MULTISPECIES: ribonuclease J [unclassified Modicisalibacter]|uniref:ribonuclease J n=1 Tax=unclassified Modicisalibacter TaxID=2679913 RepID=UPI001CCFCAD1|nr:MULTISPECIES: ribonuclease J [unclassified Modicisalibacter]MBZ9557046.1 ribonuclease J [Modicisalibacter sp. R2A 31.J]MBZ9574240.1 ribonuclease J [Modicisalibacter sp. MOD 31.J]
MNLNLYGYRDDWLAVDCGMMIRQDLPDGPLQVPDIEPLSGLGIVPRALVITHGHEDHIGAAAWLWPQWGCTVYATPLAAGLLRAKFHERGLSSEAIHVVEPGDALECGAFMLRYLPVTHSIPESCALLLSTPQHRVLHTGDWKLDPEPLIGEPVDETRFRAIAPVDLLVGDSTNALQPGWSGSEGDVARALETTLAECPGRVIVSCFASNLARVLALGRAAKRCGRRVGLMGRSMERMVRIARSLGYLEDFPPLVPVRDMGYLPAEEVLIIATGSQGEPRAALSRLARHAHPDLELQPGDTVIFSAKAIPGNERHIERLQRGLKHLDVTVLEESRYPALHASGHPARDELRTFYEWVRPRRLLPVHGEHRHQQAHREIAEELGIDAPLLPGNGDLIRLDRQGLSVERHIALTPRIVHQDNVHSLRDLESAPQDRHAREGDLHLVLPVIALESGGWQRVGRLLLDYSGPSPLDETAFVVWLDDTLEQADSETLAELRAQLKARLRNWLADHVRRPPAVHLQLSAAEAFS